MRDANLAGADPAWLSRFDGRRPVAVRSAQFTVSSGPPLDVAFVLARLDELEERLKHIQGLPVPRMAPSRRIEHF